VLLVPERGMAIFAFANRTYAGPSAPVWDVAVALLRSGALPPVRTRVVSDELNSSYQVAGRIYAAGTLAPGLDRLAMNFLLDRDAEGWARDLAHLKAQAGNCDTSAAVEAGGALTGEFTWRCAHGRIHGSLELAPTIPPTIQALYFNVIDPDR
jgi:hypothetical protein